MDELVVLKMIGFVEEMQDNELSFSSKMEMYLTALLFPLLNHA